MWTNAKVNVETNEQKSVVGGSGQAKERRRAPQPFHRHLSHHQQSHTFLGGIQLPSFPATAHGRQAQGGGALRFFSPRSTQTCGLSSHSCGSIRRTSREDPSPRSSRTTRPTTWNTRRSRSRLVRCPTRRSEAHVSPCRRRCWRWCKA